MEILGRVESLFVLLGAPDPGEVVAALDPMLFVPLGIIALSLTELRRCVRDGWHQPQA